jgi:hypothetical protein
MGIRQVQGRELLAPEGDAAKSRVEESVEQIQLGVCQRRLPGSGWSSVHNSWDGSTTG